MEEPPAKRTKLFDEDDESDDASEGVTSPSIQINEEYARRFDHNARRVERHRLEEKLGKSGADESDDSSSSEEEDEDGEFAKGAYDQEWRATLEAIRKKDPKIYDPNAVFYSATAGDEDEETKPKAQKPMFLNDYHRENLLRGSAEPEDASRQTYVQQQEDLKQTVTREMHNAAASSDEDEDGFLTKKPHQISFPAEQGALTTADVEAADADPEGYLQKYFNTKAWIPKAEVEPHPFESDDEEEEELAEAYEHAYNMRFEDPEKSNETLKTHARDIAAKYSAREEKSTRRRRARDVEREQKETRKQERAHDRARLRQLRIEEAQEKLDRIREAAGATKPGQLDVLEWQGFLTEDWDDEQWEKEMAKRFGDKYYNDSDDAGSDGSEPKKRVRKPKWDDDVDIDDLVPDYDSEQDKRLPLSEEEDGGVPLPQEKTKHDREKAKAEKRKQKRHIEQLVDSKLDLDEALDNFKGSGAGFRYRETSPIDFGMSSRDILMASDSQLNQFAGLKKLAPYREVEKKRKDKKRLGKKARLREWRRDTFGDDRGPQKTLQQLLKEELEGMGAGSGDLRSDSKRRKRKSKS